MSETLKIWLAFVPVICLLLLILGRVRWLLDLQYTKKEDHNNLKAHVDLIQLQVDLLPDPITERARARKFDRKHERRQQDE